MQLGNFWKKLNQCVGAMRKPFLIAAFYLSFGIAWIFLTDLILFTSASSAHELQVIQGLKGYLFVLISTAFIIIIGYFIIPKEVKDEKDRLIHELSEKNEFITTIINNLPIGIAVNKMDEGQATLVNDKYCEIYGWDKKYLSDVETFFERVYPNPEYRQQIKERVLSDIQSGDPQRMKWLGIPITTKDGNQKIVDATNIPLPRQKLMISTVMDRSELYHSLQKLDIAVAAGKMGTWRLHLPTEVNEVNEYWATMLGYNKSEIEQTFSFFNTLVHPEDKEKINSELKRIIEERANNLELEVRLKSKSGDYKWIMTSGRVIKRDQQGKPLVMSGIHMDITSRKLAEETLKDTNLRLSLALDANSFGIWDWDIVKDQLIWDDRMCELYDIEKGTSVNYSVWLSRVHPDDHDSAKMERELALEGKKDYNLVFRVLHTNGNIKYIRSQAKILRDDTQQPLRMVGINYDITDDINQRTELDEALTEITNILESITDGFISVNNQWIVTYWNKAAEELLGLPEGKVIGGVLWDFFEDPKNMHFFSEALMVKEIKQKSSFEEYFASRSKWFRFNIYPKEDGLSVFIKDINDEKHFKESLLENTLQSQEKERNRIAKELHDGIVQEMVACTMHFNVIKDKLSEENLIKDFQRAVDYLVKITLQTRNISHNLIAGETDTMDIEQLLNRLEQQLSFQSKTEFEFDVNLKFANWSITNYAKTQIYRVLQELINNIVKHSNANHASIQIDEVDGTLLINVSDDGTGLVKDQSLNGIGLENVRERLRSINGTIDLQNIQPHGLGAFIKIPIASLTRIMH